MKIVLMRGPSGSGKSTIAQKMGGCVFSADSYLMKNGKYVWSEKRSCWAHNENRWAVRQAMRNKTPLIIVDNTHITVREMNPYIRMANRYGYDVELCQYGVDFPSLTIEQLLERQAQRASIDKNLGLEVIERMLKKYKIISQEDLAKMVSNVPSEPYWLPVKELLSRFWRKMWR